MTAGFTQGRARGFNPTFNLVSVIVAVITFLFNSTPSAASCGFSDKSSGNYTVPSTGCQLSQMITVNGAMNVSGVPGESPLRALAAMGGTPTLAEPKRHFLVSATNQLYLKYICLRGGRVVNVYHADYSGSGMAGGTILIRGVSAALECVHVKFEGCGTSCACYGGAIMAHSGARLMLSESTFFGNTASYDGGALYINSAGTAASFTSVVFQNNTAVNG